MFGSRNPKSTCVFRKRYRIHNHRVKSIVSSAKLLLYNVKQGWKPLCDFLGCEVPTVAFPHENIRGEISKRALHVTRLGQQMTLEMRRGILLIFSAVVVIISAFLAIRSH